MLIDFLETTMELGVRRQLQVKPVKGKATVCMGVRRSGKSTYLFQIMDSLFKDGVQLNNICYINFFDDRLHDLKSENLTQVLEAYYSLYPEKKHTEKVYYFFDEIQIIAGFESFVERVLRTENCEIYLTGSSAHLLSKEIATQMRGRALSWELFPLSFSEYLQFKNLNSNETPFSTKKRLLIQKNFEYYWESGGFPEVANLEKPLRIKIHQEYFQVILFRDLIERHNISHPVAITDLAYKLIDTTSSLYTINSLTGYLQSIGHKVPKSSIAEYIEWMEDAYFLFTVRLFDASLSRSKANPKKIYCIDHALVSSISSGILLNSGHLLENMVFTALRRMTSKIYYYKTQHGKEVDFLVQYDDRSKALFQVCESLQHDQTRKREISALLEAMTELKLTTGCIITRYEEETFTIDEKTCRVVPIWKFLIE